jgi:hypothetical protein
MEQIACHAYGKPQERPMCNLDTIPAVSPHACDHFPDETVTDAIVLGQLHSGLLRNLFIIGNGIDMQKAVVFEGKRNEMCVCISRASFLRYVDAGNTRRCLGIASEIWF